MASESKTQQILKSDFVQEQLALVLPEVLRQNQDHVLRNVEAFYAGPRCESPLEAIFAGWWFGLECVFGGLALEPQHRVTVEGVNYRLDFKVKLQHPDFYDAARRVYRETLPLIGVELDGHDFHEKTKEQVTARNKRDRDLQVAGWRIFHISGSELVRRGYDAVSEVYLHARDEMIDLMASNFHAEGVTPK